MKLSAALAACASTVALASCSALEQEQAGLTPDGEIVVTSSEAPAYQPKEVKMKTVKDKLSAPVKDEGLGVTWEMQGVYADDIAGTVVTVKIRNDNDTALPKDAVKNPKLELSDGTDIDLLPYDPDVNTTVVAPGLDYPLGIGASTNLQYRFDTSTYALSAAKFTIGNVTWEGNLNL